MTPQNPDLDRPSPNNTSQEIIQDNSLTPEETEDLKNLEATVERGLRAFWEIGRALGEINTKRLYREEYKTFSEYCQNRWGISRSSAYHLIDGAKVFQNVYHGTQKILPTNERQIRPLVTLPPEQQKEVWEEVVKTAPKGKITAAHVVRCVKEITAPKDQEPPERSCWNCRYSNSELIKDEPHYFHCDKFGKLNFVDKDGTLRAAECESWNYRFSVIEPPKKEKDTFTLTLELPLELQPLIKDAASSEDLAVVDWARKILLAALKSDRL